MERVPVVLEEGAIMPKRSTGNSAGYDLHSLENVIIPPNQRRLINTGVSMAIQWNYYGRIAPRSGLAWKNGIDVLAGVIDSDYRGVIKVILQNLDSDKKFIVRKGDRIAQLIIERCYYPPLSEVVNLDNTERAAGGFGSTGV